MDKSPLPVRQRQNTSQPQPLDLISLDSDDEFVGDTVPASPMAFLPSRERHVTQPTQILDKPGLSSPASQRTQHIRSSSPIVEVPASSPFQKPPIRRPMGASSVASRMAPAGTTFRPPTQLKNGPLKRGVSNNVEDSPAKRHAAEPIEIPSSDDEDFKMPRGDIKSTNFKSQISNFRYDASADAKAKKEKLKEAEELDEKTRKGLRQLFQVFGRRFDPALSKKALKSANYIVEDAITWLDHHGRHIKGPKNGTASAGVGAPERVPSPPKRVSTPPKPARRRLVQGLRRRDSPAQSQPSPALPAPPSSDDPLMATPAMKDNDKEDAYLVESSPEPSEDGEEKVLTSLNTSEATELVAMTGLKKEQVEIFIEKRPFLSLNKARAVTLPKAAGSRGKTTRPLGETVVDAVEIFLRAVEAIDDVVTACEKKAKTVQEVMDVWDINSFGFNKRSKASSPSGNKELPPTPTSHDGAKLTPPPIAKQPGYMDGHCEMQPFQVFGMNWMTLLYNYDIGCILADEMGLGKTCQVISFIAGLVEEYEQNDEKKEDEYPWPNLIVVPPSTYDNWLAEFQKFAPDLSIIGYRGSQSERAEIAYEIQENGQEYHAVVATYSQLKTEQDVEAMQSFGLNAAIFDEGHQMKNPETQLYKFLKRIPANWRLLLTGTPVQNNLLEMISLLSFINPTLFDGYMEHIKYIFSQKVTIKNVGNGAFLYSERVKRARTILEPFILQRKKDQVLSKMPKKFSTVVRCTMTEEQRKVYDEYERVFRLEPSQRGKLAKGRGNDNNNPWMQLRKAAIHPILFRRYFDDKTVEDMGSLMMDRLSQEELGQPNLTHLINELKGNSDFGLHLWCRDYPRLLGKWDIPETAVRESGKMGKLLELIAQYRENGDRLLVFSKFALVVEVIREVLAHADIPHLVLAGSVAVSERQSLINTFNSDASIPVFLLTTSAGGTGINLTAANKVVIFDQADNPQEDIQAENRAHRLGQKRDVEIVRLLSEGTIEELIYEACLKKIELAERVTGTMSKEEAEMVEEGMDVRVRKMMKEQLTPP